MLWLEGSRVVCRLEAISVGAAPSGFPGPDRAPCLVVVDRAEQAQALRRGGWSAVLSRDVERYFRHAPIAPPLGPSAKEAQVEVVAVEPRGADAYRITFACEFIAEAARPGQFLLVECAAGGERRAFARAKNRPWRMRPRLSVDPKLPILRRPFGFHRFSGPDYAPERLRQQPPFEPQLAGLIEPGRGKTFDVLFKVVGRGTQRLAQMRRGERLSARGPLGKPIEIRRDLDTALLIAGGVGAGPLFALAQELRRQGRRVDAILGAVDRASAPLAPHDFEDIGARAALVTEKEDGLLVTDYVQRHLAEMTVGVTEVFACGPSGMLREVARIAPPGLPVQVLMEQRMACGMGVCRGCVVRLRSEGREPLYRTVCRDGPAFRAEEVAWEEMTASAG
jgi:NAD(P)H-flavin reductase